LLLKLEGFKHLVAEAVEQAMKAQKKPVSRKTVRAPSDTEEQYNFDSLKINETENDSESE
jgi:hypothetical protein